MMQVERLGQAQQARYKQTSSVFKAECGLTTTAAKNTETAKNTEILSVSRLVDPLDLCVQ